MNSQMTSLKSVFSSLLIVAQLTTPTLITTSAFARSAASELDNERSVINQSAEQALTAGPKAIVVRTKKNAAGEVVEAQVLAVNEDGVATAIEQGEAADASAVASLSSVAQQRESDFKRININDPSISELSKNLANSAGRAELDADTSRNTFWFAAGLIGLGIGALIGSSAAYASHHHHHYVYPAPAPVYSYPRPAPIYYNPCVSYYSYGWSYSWYRGPGYWAY